MKIEISFVSKSIREEVFAMKAELFGKLAELKDVIVSEKVEAQEVIKVAVAKAIAPLETEIAALRDQLTNGASPADLELAVADVTEALSAVKDIVTPEDSVDAPVEPV